MRSGRPACQVWLQGRKGQDRGDVFVLNTQMVISRGIYLLVRLAMDEVRQVRQSSIDALHVLTVKSPRLKSILVRATQDDGLLEAVAAGETLLNVWLKHFKTTVRCAVSVL